MSNLISKHLKDVLFSNKMQKQFIILILTHPDFTQEIFRGSTIFFFEKLKERLLLFPPLTIHEQIEHLCSVCVVGVVGSGICMKKTFRVITDNQLQLLVELLFELKIKFNDNNCLSSLSKVSFHFRNVFQNNKRKKVICLYIYL